MICLLFECKYMLSLGLDVNEIAIIHVYINRYYSFRRFTIMETLSDELYVIRMLQCVPRTTKRGYNFQDGDFGEWSIPIVAKRTCRFHKLCRGVWSKAEAR